MIALVLSGPSSGALLPLEPGVFSLGSGPQAFFMVADSTMDAIALTLKVEPQGVLTVAPGLWSGNPAEFALSSDQAASAGAGATAAGATAAGVAGAPAAAGVTAAGTTTAEAAIWLNGHELTQPQVVPAGSLLRLGLTEIFFSAQEHGSEEELWREAQQAQAQLRQAELSAAREQAQAELAAAYAQEQALQAKTTAASAVAAAAVSASTANVDEQTRAASLEATMAEEAAASSAPAGASAVADSSVTADTNAPAATSAPAAANATATSGSVPASGSARAAAGIAAAAGEHRALASWRPFLVPGIMATVGSLLLGGMLYLLVFAGAKHSPAANEAQVRDFMQSHHIEQIRITRHHGYLQASGVVATQEYKDQILASLPDLDEVLVINLQTYQSLSDDVARAFALRGATVRVDRTTDNQMHIFGYVKDEATAQALLATVRLILARTATFSSNHLSSTKISPSAATSTATSIAASNTTASSTAATNAPATSTTATNAIPVSANSAVATANTAKGSANSALAANAASALAAAPGPAASHAGEPGPLAATAALLSSEPAALADTSATATNTSAAATSAAASLPGASAATDASDNSSSASRAVSLGAETDMSRAVQSVNLLGSQAGLGYEQSLELNRLAATVELVPHFIYADRLRPLLEQLARKYYLQLDYVYAPFDVGYSLNQRSNSTSRLVSLRASSNDRISTVAIKAEANPSLAGDDLSAPATVGEPRASAGDTATNLIAGRANAEDGSAVVLATSNNAQDNGAATLADGASPTAATSLELARAGAPDLALSAAAVAAAPALTAAAGAPDLTLTAAALGAAEQSLSESYAATPLSDLSSMVKLSSDQRLWALQQELARRINAPINLQDRSGLVAKYLNLENESRAALAGSSMLNAAFKHSLLPLYHMGVNDLAMASTNMAGENSRAHAGPNAEPNAGRWSELARANDRGRHSNNGATAGFGLDYLNDSYGSPLLAQDMAALGYSRSQDRDSNTNLFAAWLGHGRGNGATSLAHRANTGVSASTGIRDSDASSPWFFDSADTLARGWGSAMNSGASEDMTLDLGLATGRVAAQDEALPEELWLDIMSVTMEPLRFVTLRDGLKVFEGGMLPSGQVVTQIEIDHLLLQDQHGREVRYELK